MLVATLGTTCADLGMDEILANILHTLTNHKRLPMPMFMVFIYFFFFLSVDSFFLYRVNRGTPTSQPNVGMRILVDANLIAN